MITPKGIKKVIRENVGYVDIPSRAEMNMQFLSSLNVQEPDAKNRAGKCGRTEHSLTITSTVLMKPLAVLRMKLLSMDLREQGRRIEYICKGDNHGKDQFRRSNPQMV